MKRLIGSIVISTGALLVLFVAVGVVWLFTLSYRNDRRSQRLVESISEKLAPFVISTPVLVWDTDLRPYGFPQDSFDSPYTAYVAPTTVAMSDALAAVTFRKSHLVGRDLEVDGHLITVSLATGSVVKTTQWRGPIGVGPYVFCCTTDRQFYGYADTYLIVRDGEVVGRQEVSPVGPSTEKVTGRLGTNGRPSTIDIVHEDRSRSSFQTGCAGVVHDSFLSKDTLVITSDCSTLSVIGTDGHVFFSDVFPGAEVKFGGASKNGRRLILSVTVWHPGDPPYLMDEWLVVYDIQHRGPVFAVKSDPLPYMQSQSALSADGNRLLIGSGGHLKLLSALN